jgi:hypothetical protein
VTVDTSGLLGGWANPVAQQAAIGHQYRDRIAERASRGDSGDSSGLVIIDGKQTKGITVPEIAASIKVKVRAPFRVVHDGTVYTGGDVLDIPDDEAHKLWFASGWVERVPEPEPEPAKAAPKRSKRSG